MKTKQEFLEEKFAEFERCHSDKNAYRHALRHLTILEEWLFDELYKHEVAGPEMQKLPKAELTAASPSTKTKKEPKVNK